MHGKYTYNGQIDFLVNFIFHPFWAPKVGKYWEWVLRRVQVTILWSFLLFWKNSAVLCQKNLWAPKLYFSEPKYFFLFLVIYCLAPPKIWLLKYKFGVLGVFLTGTIVFSEFWSAHDHLTQMRAYTVNKSIILIFLIIHGIKNKNK